MVSAGLAGRGGIFTVIRHTGKKLAAHFGAERFSLLLDSFVSLCLRGASAVLTLLLGILIGRSLGVEGAGLYFTGITILRLGGIIGAGGQNLLTIRLAAGASGRELRGLESEITGLRTIIWRSFALALPLSGILAATGWLTADWIAQSVFDQPGASSAIRMASAGIVLLALCEILAGVLQGMRANIASVLIQEILRSATAICLFLLFFAQATPEDGILFYIIGIAVACASGLLLLLRPMIRAQPTTLPAQLRWTALFAAGAALLAPAIGTVIRDTANILLLGSLGSLEDVGLFSIAIRLVSVIYLASIAINRIVSPRLAAAHAVGDRITLAATARTAMAIAAAVALPVCLAMAFLAEPLMAIFGEGFGAGAPLLYALLPGAALFAIMGPMGFMLMMTGHEKDTAWITAVSVAVLIGGCLVLIPQMGAMGAAIATTASIVAERLLTMRYVGLRLGISPSGRLLTGAKQEPRAPMR